ncbi:hypothetical protein F4818DRAFT_443804 [Hypoxylon cercidicola]|nr:hypothetical protein F4818DRAFT_443804 [Hypoxylon cercidicola]
MRRPVCRKCIKAKRTCTGYDRDFIFVNRTPSSSSATATSVLAERRARRQAADPGSEADLHYLFSESWHNCGEFRRYALKLLEATYLPKLHVSERFSWAYCLPDLLKPSKSLDTSLFAFCLSQLHVTGAGSASLYQCLDQYNTALRYLYADLDDEGRRSQEETLAAIIVLSTCELFIYPTASGWSIHARGINEILRLRDPEAANTPAWRHLSSRIRIVCTLEALTKRQGQILKCAMYRRAITESSISCPLDEVFRMTADIPAILEQAVALCSIRDHDALLRESAAVTQSILAMVKSFEVWLDECWKASSSLRVWSVPSRAVNLADVDPSNKNFPYCFEFESLVVGVPVVMCWAVATQLYSHVIQIYDLVQARLGRHITLQYLLTQADTTVVDAASHDSPLLTADRGRSIQDVRDEGTRMARNVCQSMEYMHRIEMGTYGGHSTTYPTWSARQYFRLHPGHEREASWLQNMHKMEGTGTRWGLSLMTFADIEEPLAGLCQDLSKNRRVCAV